MNGLPSAFAGKHGFELRIPACQVLRRIGPLVRIDVNSERLAPCNKFVRERYTYSYNDWLKVIDWCVRYTF
jgi:hypothetical protein